MAQLANDPEYQRRRAASDAGLQARVDVLRVAEQPIVDDLGTVGVHVESVWDFVNTAVPYPDALPILFAHLARGGYPDRVMESLGRALAVGPASVYWDDFRRLFAKAVGPDEKDGLAVAMAASATGEHLDAMLDILGDQSWGDYRIYFVRPILRVGGLRGSEVISALTNDPVLGKEATALLKKKR